MMKEIRKKIDAIDEKIILLVKERADLAKKIGKEKERSNLQVADLDREKEVMENVRAVAKEKNINEELAEKIFKEIVQYSKEIQKRRR